MMHIEMYCVLSLLHRTGHQSHMSVNYQLEALYCEKCFLEMNYMLQTA